MPGVGLEKQANRDMRKDERLDKIHIITCEKGRAPRKDDIHDPIHRLELQHESPV